MQAPAAGRESAWTRRAVLGGAGAFCGLGGSPARTAGAVVSFGLTPVFLDSDIQLLANLEAYLERVIGGPVALVKRRTYQEITTLLLTGQLDAAWICGFPFVQHADRLALVGVPLFRGRPLYQSYVIVRSDAVARDFAELRGGIHAFSDPESNSGFLVTRCLLADIGATPDSFFSRAFFTYGHRNVIRAVASGLAQSGSVDGYVWEVMKETEPELVGATRVLRRSEWLGFPPVASLRSAAGDRNVVALAAALRGMAADPVGKAVLAELRLDGFAAAEPSLFDGIAAKYAQVRESL